MKVFFAFCKKELVESVRTYRLLIMLITFVILGIMSPLVAKMLPDILKNADLGGMTLTIPEPTAFDSWTQFYSNMGQMGMLIMIVVFGGITAQEFSKGTLVNILTKGVRRSTVVVSKYLVASVIWTLSYVVAFAVTYAYTVYYWGSEKLPHAVLAFSGPWVYGLLLLALLVLGGILFKSFYGSLSLAGGAVVLMTLVHLAPKLQKYNPISLAGDALGLLNKQKVPADFTPALMVCLALTLGCLVASVLIFNRKQL